MVVMTPASWTTSTVVVDDCKKTPHYVERTAAGMPGTGYVFIGIGTASFRGDLPCAGERNDKTNTDNISYHVALL